MELRKISIKYLFCLIALIINATLVDAQIIQLNDTPALKASLNRDEKPIYISGVDKEVKINGHFASTTIEYTLFNPNSRTMEASFEFSLAEGQSISSFALDLDGKWRDGVPVEKAKGQQVFESVIRQNIDPALLEKTVGNNYRARVYPLLPKSSRKVKIRYDEELSIDQGLSSLRIPISSNDSLQRYALTITVEGSYTPLLNQNIIPNLNFRPSGNDYVVSLSLDKQNVDSSVNVVIAKSQENRNSNIYVEKCSNSNQYAFYTQVYTDLKFPQKNNPKMIDLYWDISASASERNMDKELNLLNDYISYLGDVAINLYTFNIKSSQCTSYNIKNGQWANLKTSLSNQVYDGATQLASINTSKSNADEILVFSDGVSNFGDDNLQINTKKTKPIVLISTSPKANYNYLRYWSNKTNGEYINLLTLDNQQALQMLTNPSIKLISAIYNKSQIEQLTVQKITGTDNGFSIVGILTQPNAKLKLDFGVGQHTFYSKDITINSQRLVDHNGIVERICIERYINHLSSLNNAYNTQIADLAKQYGIVTDNMSLIVLDRLEDYLTFRITPPQELLEEYNKRIEEDNRYYQDDYDYRMRKLQANFEERTDWWDGKEEDDYDTPKENIFKKIGNKLFRKNKTEINNSNNSYSGEKIVGTLNYADNNLKGQLIDTFDDWAIPGLIIKNETSTTTMLSDLDGNFEIFAKIGDRISFSYLGYETATITLSNNTKYIEMPSNQHVLEEMVVVGYGTSSQNNTPFEAPALEALTNNEVQEDDTEDELEEWVAGSDYIELLGKSDDTDIYHTYLKIKDKYNNTPSFYLDVASIFQSRNLNEESLLILSNLAEMELQNYKVLRVLAHRLSQLGYPQLAQPIFETVLTLRPEEPHSYRDLALCYEQNGMYQEAINLFSEALNKDWDGRFDEIEQVLLQEMNHTIALGKRKGKRLDLSHIDKRLIKNMPLDIRIVLNWDTDNSDMDLHVFDPNNEECYYNHDRTKIGGMLPNDYTGGYGPEEFLLKKAKKGVYKISADYFGSREQTLIGPTTIYLDIFTNYSKSNEKKQTIMLRLDKKDNGVLEVGEIKW